MDNNQKGTCPHCSALMVEYTFTFNSGLATFLSALYEAKEPVRTDELGLTYSQRTNSQKLRYWGLAEQVKTGTAAKKGGVWKITRLGIDFVEGRVRIPRKVTMYRNTFRRYADETDTVSFNESHAGYNVHIDYAIQAAQQVA